MLILDKKLYLQSHYHASACRSLKMYLILWLILNVVPNFEALPSKQDLLNELVNVPPAEDTLLFAHVLFRHGDRTPTSISTYANDPNKYASYWPIGVGQLTKLGMLETYKLGLELRKRYDNFLGNVYFPDLIGGLSSPKPRCKTSLQSVFAALFPPSEEEQFIADLQWRPIAYEYLSDNEDDTFALYECDNYWNLTHEVTDKSLFDLYDYLTEQTGEPIRNSSALFILHETISVTIKLGKPQPKWVFNIYPEPLRSACREVYYDMLQQRLRLGASGLYRRLTSDIVKKLEGKLSPPRRKMMLYSAHEQTLVYALGGIEAYSGQVPKLASYLAFEWHYINQTYGLKVLFQNYDEVAPVPINILQQGEFCPLEVLLNGTKWLTEGPKPFCRK